MKHSFLAVFLLACFSGNSAFSEITSREDLDEEKNQVEEFSQIEMKTSPLALWAKWVTLEVGFRINESFAFGPSYTRYAGDSNQVFGALKGNAYGLYGTYSFQGQYGSGWYSTARFLYEDYLRYAQVDSTDLYDKQKKEFTLSTILGYQFETSEHFFIQTGAGPQFRRSDIQEIGGVSENHKFQVYPFIEAKLGVHF